MIETAIRAAKAGGETLLRYHARLRDDQIALKGPNDFVAEADRESEQRVSEVLRSAFPDHAITGEEGGASAGSAEYRWFIDPLDGTTNFVYGIPFFCVSVGLARGEDLLLGVVYDPLRQELFAAERGRGATLNGAPLRVSSCARIEDALLMTGFPFKQVSHADAYVASFSALMRRSRSLRRCGAAALDLCYVAAGRADGFWEWGLSPWDIAAGAVILSEAGGRITDFRGQGAYMQGDVMATNGRIHEAMAGIVGDAFAHLL
ncbi:MAG: inositol monophosphatase [Candidatus Latescibacteria bacterium]|nr:inositol monophosphatase [Candidatus Latescibacterota bacterium]